MSDMRGKKPRVRAADTAELQLTPEERFLMSRIDGQLSVEDLSNVTGLASVRVEQIVSRLSDAGAVELTDGDEKASLADFAAALGMDPGAFGEAPPPAPPKEPPRHPVLRRYTPAKPFPAAQPAPLTDDATEEPEPVADLDRNLEPPLEENDAEGATEPDEAAEARPVDEPEEVVVAERNYREVYATRWHPLSTDQRIAGAHGAQGSDLLALCFDPDARVIAAVLENASVGLDHARLIAMHHRTGTGLEVLARRQDWLRDLLVERRLLRNPMIGPSVLGRVIAPKALFQTYKIAIDRDVPDLTRTKCRGYVRQKWQTASSEERADLLVRTEARCLTIMSGCTFDAKTTGILCGRPINSAMFVQSIAKFGASPPGLLAHLMKQPFVRKNAALKKMLLAHPNMPGDIKRSI